MAYVKAQTLANSFLTGDAVLEQLLYLSELFDLYGPLLTEKQQECLSLHLLEDFSLSEVGEALGISRQAAYDNIHRSEKAMEAFEAKLGLVARYRRERAELMEIAEKVRQLRKPDNAEMVDSILARLEPLAAQSGQIE